MCIFCKNETIRKELEKCYIDYCDNCKGNIKISKKNGNIIILKYPKKDRIRVLLYFIPYILIGLFVIPLLITNLETILVIKIFLIGIIIFVAFLTFLKILNIRNYKKYDYMYYGFINVITKDGNKSLLKILNISKYILLVLYIQFIIVMSIVIYKGIIY